MSLAKQSTAKTFLVGPILDADGVAKTDEVVASIKVTKNGTVGAVDAEDTLTHNHTGHYVFVSDGGDFDTVGEVEFSLNSGTNAMAPVKFQVVPANVYDSVMGTDVLDVSLTQVNGAAQTATLDTIKAETVLIVADTGELQTNQGAWATATSVTVSDKTGFSLASTGADLILKSSTFVQAIAAAINELATYGLTALNTLLVTTGIKAASVPALVQADVRAAVGMASANLDTQLAALPTATEVIDEFETQSQVDPTGFHVNVKEVNGTAQTASDLGADKKYFGVDLSGGNTYLKQL